jgi:hypothetical protein
VSGWDRMREEMLAAERERFRLTRMLADAVARAIGPDDHDLDEALLDLLREQVALQEAAA